MKSAAKIIEKLRKPPAVHNWVRHIRRRRDDTALALRNFALNPPRTSLVAVTSVCSNIVVDQISLDQAMRCVGSIKDQSTRERAFWIVRAFHKFVSDNHLSGIQVFRDMVGFYPVAAGIRVPVRPTFVLNDNGYLVPYFVICWTKVDLTFDQRCLLSTLVERTILTLEEFSGSDAVIVCTPLAPYSKKEREVITWKVSEYPCLEDEQLQEVFDRYAGAMDDAQKMIIESLG